MEEIRPAVPVAEKINFHCCRLTISMVAETKSGKSSLGTDAFAAMICIAICVITDFLMVIRYFVIAAIPESATIWGIARTK